jgi:hypothetical protein
LPDDRLIELISASLDGALDAEETAELEAALQDSPAARDLVQAMAADREALRALPAVAAPPALKARALQTIKSMPAELGRPWQRMLALAACVGLVFGLFSYFRPVRSLANSVMYLRPGKIAARAAAVSQELHLAAEGAGHSHVMVSEGVSAHYHGGPTRLHLLCDAGLAPGGRLLVRLSFDFDGDGKVDVHTEPQVLQVDHQRGYQELACTWPALAGMKDLKNGRVQVEVAAGEPGGPPLSVRLEPQQAALELPFDDIKTKEGPPT